MSQPLSLYLHIPFCHSKCTYCAFNTYIRLEHLISPFVEALQAELRCCAPGVAGRSVHTVFFGGGTPSLLQPQQLADILRTIHLCFDVESSVEVSLEANPNDLNEQWLAAVADAGINRLSIGVP
ncbi:MAG: radical SAM protein, partial [Anaerolineaceae bacterium]|nr:radical SAM protein [Anaerolineaceae bacterium]